MLFTTLFVAALSSMAAAQTCSSGNTTGTSLSIDPNSVPMDLRLSWCRAQTNSCPMICSQGTSENSCDATTLTYCCTCSGGNTPNISSYEQTIPFYICQQYIINCINSHPNDLSGQTACQQTKCGNLNATNGQTISSSATGTAAMTASGSGGSGSNSASATGSMTSGGSSSGSATGSSASSTASQAAAAALEVGMQYGTGIGAVIAAGLFGLAL